MHIFYSLVFQGQLIFQPCCVDILLRHALDFAKMIYVDRFRPNESQLFLSEIEVCSYKITKSMKTDLLITTVFFFLSSST
jgi:hypothetical protein